MNIISSFQQVAHVIHPVLASPRNRGLAESLAKKPHQHQNNNHTTIQSPFSRTNLRLKTFPLLLDTFSYFLVGFDIMASNEIFSLEGKGLKLDTAQDIEPHIKDLKGNNDVEEVRLLGNTLGIGASEALAKVLETKKKLQV